MRKGLITSGMFQLVRHPNYSGEMLIYGAYVLLVRHWIAVVVVAVVWSSLFAARIAAKERSMQRYAEWAAYRQRTWLLVPYVL